MNLQKSVEAILKSRVRGYYRTTKSGKRVFVKEHVDTRSKKQSESRNPAMAEANKKFNDTWRFAGRTESLVQKFPGYSTDEQIDNAKKSKLAMKAKYWELQSKEREGKKIPKKEYQNFYKLERECYSLQNELRENFI